MISLRHPCISYPPLKAIFKAALLLLFSLGVYGQGMSPDHSASNKDASMMVNINSASAAELAKAIRGVGGKLSKRIIAERKENGPFDTIYDLARVRGIGISLVERNREKLKVK